MRAMVMTQPGQPLRLVDLEVPQPKAGQVLLKVHACGVCRTDLHVVDGELAQPCIMNLLLMNSGTPGEEGRTPRPTWSGKARSVDEAPVFSFLLREIGQYLWPDEVGSPH